MDESAMGSRDTVPATSAGGDSAATSSGTMAKTPPRQRASSKAASVDLGTAYPCVGVWKNDGVEFAAYKQFRDDTTVEQKRATEEANERIEVLEADIQKYASDAAQLTKEITGLDEDIST